VKASTIDELHSLQKKKSAPTTPISGNSTPFATLTDEERQKMQLQSIRYTILVTFFLINQKIN
jgi:phosphoenolpyruvate carboxykinase (ATP)